MADAEQCIEWEQACELQDKVLGLLQQEYTPLAETLLRLVHPLLAWGLLEDHDASNRGGIGSAHDAVDRKLAAALCCVMDVVADARIPQTAEHLADRILAERQQQTTAHKSHALLRLVRLRSAITQLHNPGPGDQERDALVTVCTELLCLCDHLGLTGKHAKELQGGAA